MTDVSGMMSIMQNSQPEAYSLGRVTALESETGIAWVEMLQGGITANLIDNFPEAEIGSLVYVGLQSGDLSAAPEVARWPRQFRALAALKSFSNERAIIDIAGSIRAVDSDSIVKPIIGAQYLFDERDQRWLPLTEVETRVLDVESSDISPFNIENLQSVDGGSDSFGGMKKDFDQVIRAVEGNFASRHFPDGARSAAKPSAGAVFFGPPGTGKTHLARSVAQELNATLISVNGPELLDKYLGSTEKAFRALFRLAQDSPRSIIFIDEFDTIGSQRGPEVHEAINRQVGQLLSLMDPATEGPRPFVIAATNRLEDVDVAFLRPGRFDLAIEFKHPGRDERQMIMQAQTRSLEIRDTACLPWLAEVTDRWTPAELGLIWTGAEMNRVEDGRTNLSIEDIMVGFAGARNQHATVERAMNSFAVNRKE